MPERPLTNVLLRRRRPGTLLRGVGSLLLAASGVVVWQSAASAGPLTDHAPVLQGAGKKAPSVPKTSKPKAHKTSHTAWWDTSPASELSMLGASSPLTPTGGLQVTTDGSTTTAFGAIWYKVPLTSGGQKVDPSSIQAVLTLSLDTTDTVGTPALEACPTASKWKPGGDQPAKKAPKYVCSHGLGSPGNYNSSSNTVTWNLSALQERKRTPGLFSVAIVPAGGLGASSSFSAEFNAPDKSSFSVLSWAPAGRGGSSAGAPPSPGLGTPAAAPGPVSPGASAGGGSYAPSSPASSSPSVAGPSGSAPTGSGSGAPKASTTGSTATGTTGTVPATLTTHGMSGAAQRNLAFGLLIAAALVLASNKKVRRPRLLVPVGSRAKPVPGN